MYFEKAILCFVCFLACISCEKESCNPNDVLELRMDFTEEEFLMAIIGKWESVWETDGFENVTYLELCKQGNAKITLKEGSTVEYFEGNYTVEFTNLGYRTRADITITTPKRNIILSDAQFDLHNGLSVTKLYFRTYGGSPKAVLSRIE